MQRNSVNKVMLVGHMGSDPDVRYTPKGFPIANLNRATNDSRKNETGEYADHSEWHKIVLIGKLAEFAEKNIKKGAFLYVEGKLQTRNWEDKEGVKHYSTEVKGDVVTLLGSRKKGDAKEPDVADNEVNEDEIPF